MTGSLPFSESELGECNFMFSNIFSNMPSCTVGPGEALSKCSQHESRLPLSTDPLWESAFFCNNLWSSTVGVGSSYFFSMWSSLIWLKSRINVRNDNAPIWRLLSCSKQVLSLCSTVTITGDDSRKAKLHDSTWVERTAINSKNAHLLRSLRSAAEAAVWPGVGVGWEFHSEFPPMEEEILRYRPDPCL